MSPEQQLIAIAEACGWRECWINQNGAPWGFLGALYYSQSIPNYLNDLNAMHDAEKMLTHDQMIDYSRHVGKLVTSHLPASRAAWMDFRLINATASQRAEAFLRTIGKWEECK